MPCPPGKRDRCALRSSLDKARLRRRGSATSSSRNAVQRRPRRALRESHSHSLNCVAWTRCGVTTPSSTRLVSNWLWLSAIPFTGWAGHRIVDDLSRPTRHEPERIREPCMPANAGVQGSPSGVRFFGYLFVEKQKGNTPGRGFWKATYGARPGLPPEGRRFTEFLKKSSRGRHSYERLASCHSVSS